MCLKGPREGNATSSDTHHPSPEVGFPGEVPSTAPDPHNKLRGSILRGPPNEAHLFVWNATHSTFSFWERGTSRHLHVGIPITPYYFKLLLDPTMDLFLFLVGRVLNIFKSWAQSVLSPFKADPVMKMRLVRNGSRSQTSTKREAWPWERVCTKEHVLLLVINFSFSWLPSGSLFLTHACLNKFHRILNHSLKAPPNHLISSNPSWS